MDPNANQSQTVDLSKCEKGVMAAAEEYCDCDLRCPKCGKLKRPGAVEVWYPPYPTPAPCPPQPGPFYVVPAEPFYPGPTCDLHLTAQPVPKGETQ